ncbi:hypothetical protein D3C87_1151840 [compost metagenome]
MSRWRNISKAYTGESDGTKIDQVYKNACRRRCIKSFKGTAIGILKSLQEEYRNFYQ